MPVVAQAMPQQLMHPTPPPWPAPPVAAQPSPLAGLGLPAWFPDPYVHRAALLSAAGGTALVVLGLRTIAGGRRA